MILASGSPRRRELLTAAGYEFDVVPADIDESAGEDETPTRYVERLAREKCLAVPGDFVLAADTTVDVDGIVFSKPADVDDARRMLRALSGRAHVVHTGVAIRRRKLVRSFVVTTEVDFIELADYEIDAYIASGEPMDKAGAYALQGGAARFVRAVRGSVSNVIGLPMAEVALRLDRAAADVVRRDLTIECDASLLDTIAEEVTAALCGEVLHAGPCRWPHIVMRSSDSPVELGVIVLARADEFDVIRDRLANHFGAPSAPWRLVDDKPGLLDRHDRDQWWSELATEDDLGCTD
jgi:septum formation protein